MQSDYTAATAVTGPIWEQASGAVEERVPFDPDAASPADAHALYAQYHRSDSAVAHDDASKILPPHTQPQYYPHGPMPPAPRTQSRPASRTHHHTHQQPPSQSRTLASVKSQPVLLPSRQSGTVKDIANRFDQRDGGRSNGSSRQAGARRSRSPLKEGAISKLLKRRPDAPKSPRKTPASSFETTSSLSSNTAAPKDPRNQPHAAFNPKRARTPTSPKSAAHVTSRPLFGEITADGHWNGNFDLGAYGQLPILTAAQRRGSDGALALGSRLTGHSQQRGNDHELLAPHAIGLGHKRSQSDLSGAKPRISPSMPHLNANDTPKLFPQSSQPSFTLTTTSPPPSRSRLPLTTRTRRSSDASAPSSSSLSRPASALSNHASSLPLSKAPNRRPKSAGRENTQPSGGPSGRRYGSPQSATAAKTPTSANQKLSAKIISPSPRVSPPLRSSRPRQPVSSATTSASRARAAEASRQFRSATSTDRRAPSEQWLGKPYDPQKERVNRKIPQLGKVDFEQRRAQIQKAISQNLEESKSMERLRARDRSRARLAEGVDATQATAGAENEEISQTRSADDEPHDLGNAGAGDPCRSRQSPHPPRGDLSVETVGLLDRRAAHQDAAPTTATTQFEDESPIFGRAMPPGSQYAHRRPNGHDEFESVEDTSTPVQVDSTSLLAPTTYKPNDNGVDSKAATPTPQIVIARQTPSEEEERGVGVLQHAMRMREHSEPSGSSRDGTEFSEESPAAEDSPSDMESKWGLDNTGGLGFDRSGSIKIILADEHAANFRQEDWAKEEQLSQQSFSNRSNNHHHGLATEGWHTPTYTGDAFDESPIDREAAFATDAQATPRDESGRDETLKPTTFQPHAAFTVKSNDLTTDNAFAEAVNNYTRTGEVSPDMLRELEERMIDLNGVSMNGGSDAVMVQNLLDSIVNSREQPQQRGSGERYPKNGVLELPIVTPDTPSDFDMTDSGAAMVYGFEPDDRDDELDDDDLAFAEKIRKADEDWERQQREQDAGAGASFYGFEPPPPPPPKDDGYTARSSFGQTPAANLLKAGLRISTTGNLDAEAILAAATDSVKSSATERSYAMSPHPPPPNHTPPPPPPLRMPDSTPSAASEAESSEVSPGLRRSVWGPGASSSRPSHDSQWDPRHLPPLPGPGSITSLGDSNRQSWVDADSQTKSVKAVSPGPEQKRLQKRRHIIKELIDTENTYHQDLTIIEDIYKATTGDLVSTEDKKTLFGNCDEIERFSLAFYDELRKAVTAIYAPPKMGKWSNKRGSYSTTQSDGTGQTSMSLEPVDVERDRTTSIGQVFLRNLTRMEHVYGTYLKNHDAANQRLAVLQSMPQVKCWLDECHKHASDITSAWDLDSLLVKPTQRLAKYPMLLHQLLETTPPDHPDYENLKTAASNSISMLTRINEAKKRADLVDQIVNRKPKDSRTSGGLFKMGGITRRTEKLKERVGVAEAFQDPEFDELAHRFGGHFIRLQICMRDVQDYVNRTERAIGQIHSFAQALEQFADATPSTAPEIESKWRRYCLAVREVSAIALADHKEAVHRRVIQPMVTCIKLHEGPQNAINKRKKRIVDYARCRAIEKRGEKPDKRTIEAAELYTALNEQLKIDLPKLYTRTGQLVQNCLKCFLDNQCKWLKTWELKIQPILDKTCSSVQEIVPDFRADYNIVAPRINELSMCNGSLLIESYNFLSPVSTITAESDHDGSKRPSTVDGSKRTTSTNSTANSPALNTPDSARESGHFAPVIAPAEVASRVRSGSSISVVQQAATITPSTAASSNRQWSANSMPSYSYTGAPGRPGTSHRPSADASRSPRPNSGSTFVTAQEATPNLDRFSGIFSSAVPIEGDYSQAAAGFVTSPIAEAPSDTPIQFVCASLFEFNIDGARKEAGYPYLTYTQGEVFDVLAQKGELWLAKNQDDPSNTLGWIWEQHFVVLTSD